jgi:hypothetical protein
MEIKTPFDIINVMGTSKYSEVPTVDKNRHSFIINRMISRTFPEHSNKFNHMSMKPHIIVDMWNSIFTRFYKSKSGQHSLKKVKDNMRISMSKKKETTTGKIDNDLFKKLLILCEFSKKEGEILKNLERKELIKYLKKVDKMIKTV